jgi:hypothetical protein
MIDCACGHGLVGLLYAAFEPAVTSVLLVDTRRPESFRKVMESFAEVAPWASKKVEYVQGDLRSDALFTSFAGGGDTSDRPVQKGVVGIHACGEVTDVVLDLAVRLGAPVAVMPCCYTGTSAGVPFGVRRALGVGMAADVGRSFRMQAHGYHVDWAAIPSQITPMNRIIIGEPQSPRSSKL